MHYNHPHGLLQRTLPLQITIYEVFIFTIQPSCFASMLFYSLDPTYSVKLCIVGKHNTWKSNIESFRWTKFFFFSWEYERKISHKDIFSIHFVRCYSRKTWILSPMVSLKSNNSLPPTSSAASSKRSLMFTPPKAVHQKRVKF